MAPQPETAKNFSEQCEEKVAVIGELSEKI
jgi:hypothetical protein